MEMFDICNDDGSDAGYSECRSVVHEKGLWHRTVHIWVVNIEEMLLLQKRSLQKDVYPGYWDISCAGHIDAGEENLSAAIRELSEELGLYVNKNDLTYLFTVRQQYHSSSPLIIDNEFPDVFLLRYHDRITIGNDELTDLCYVKPQNLTDGSIEKLADHTEEYTLLQKWLKNNSESDRN